MEIRNDIPRTAEPHQAPTHEIPPQILPPTLEPTPPSFKARAVNLQREIKSRIERMSKTKFRLIVIGTLLALTLIGRFAYTFFTTESTDDAFVEAHIDPIGSRVSGTVSQVLVQENQKVKKGDVLIKIDPSDFMIQLDIAQANFTKASEDLQRWRGHVPWEPSEKLLYDKSEANYADAKAKLEKANLQLGYTNIVAVEDGKIGKRGVEVGQQVEPGQPLIALVEQKPWVTANFKENQFAHIRVGQKAEISIDAVPGHVFKGHVVSLAPGSGSVFALLPPDNATGNFTKIVQRIPVRIGFDKGALDGYIDRIGPGMSTEVTVFTRSK